MRVVLIHGRGQAGKDPKVLRTEWLDTLELGCKAANRAIPSRDLFVFPYYGDELARLVTGAKLPDAASIAERGPGGVDDYARFARDVLYEMEEKHPSITVEAARAEVAVIDSTEKGPQNWPLVHGLVKFIDRHWPSASGFTIEQFLRDVFLYTTRPAITTAVNKLVAEQFTDDEPTVVVAHSLGTIVSYQVMLENRDRLNVVKHVTVGSPLGINAITAALAKLGVPQNQATGGWYNAYDKDDIVALNPLDKSHFPTNPAIVNNGNVHNQTSNQHGIKGYLNDPAVATAIVDAIESVT